ncbi:diphthine--ammonia ligase [Candidatus Woesearchaeota archaeon]|nr:diphthine--ammonia ligase [Candidatus Woesearchaeota archaeon]
MCGIIGIFQDKKANKKIKLALSLLRNRGKDGFGISSECRSEYKKRLGEFSVFGDSNLLGHTLHSIVGFVSQPLRRKGLLVANCEIYNWKDLAKKYDFKVNNDVELLLQFLDKFGVADSRLEELDGVYAFAYWREGRVYLARDLLGVKPVWYVGNKGFAFASEKKVLERLGYQNVEELNPRQTLIYTITQNKFSFARRRFFTYLPEHQGSKEEIKKKLAGLLNQAIVKRIPERRFGVLFSGGIDSAFIARILAQKSCKFNCYLAVLDNKEIVPSDLMYAQKASRELGLKLMIRKVKLNELATYLPEVVSLIEDTNVVKVSIALTLYLACEKAKKDGCKVIFSGLGSEEIFAGYERHKYSSNINQECISGLIKLYERDLYRDDVITMANNLELRLPFLDKSLVQYALKIPQKYKLTKEYNKLILREIALESGISKEIAFRKKVAAQYGSRIDWALDKLAKRNKFFSRSAYLQTLYPSPNLKLGVLFSSGKDSTYAALIMQRQNYELSCLITVKSENKDSYMFHTPTIDLAQLQAKAMGLPLVMHHTKGEKEVELRDLEWALREAKEKYHINGVVAGALFSTYQRDRIEKVCDRLGLKIFSPLWHKPQEQEMQELLSNGFKFIFTGVAAEGLDKSWLNKVITKEDVETLKKLKDRLGINIAGEGGETESLVLDCPLFKKKLVIKKAEVFEESRNVARLVVKNAKLENKP